MHAPDFISQVLLFQNAEWQQLFGFLDAFSPDCAKDWILAWSKEMDSECVWVSISAYGRKIWLLFLFWLVTQDTNGRPGHMGAQNWSLDPNINAYIL